MNISFILDREEAINPSEALGDIIITNNQSKIAVNSTYLDSWFAVLINGYESLAKNQQITLEIIEEPDLITFSCTQENEFKISYGKQEVLFNNLEEFYQSLIISLREFIKQFAQENIKIHDYPLFTKINSFLPLKLITI